jgi:hypothetical protein
MPGLVRPIGASRPGIDCNLHKTDLIGGPVFTGPDASRRDADQCLLDPSTSRYVPRDPMPPVLGHSSYMRDLSMNRYVEGLASQFLIELGTEGPETDQDGEAKTS